MTDLDLEREWKIIVKGDTTYVFGTSGYAVREAQKISIKYILEPVNNEEIVKNMEAAQAKWGKNERSS